MDNLTPSSETQHSEEDTSDNAIGGGIKRYRRKNKWSLKTLSEKCGVPVSTLSKVENGQMSLKIEKLLAVSDALGIDVMQLVAPAETEGPVALITGRRSITRAKTAPVSKTEHATYQHHAHDFTHRHFSPAVIEISPDNTPELVSHQGEEFIYVLEGKIEALTEYYEPTVLEAGDSIYIDSTMAHNVRALGGRPAKVLNVSSVKRRFPQS